MSVYTAFVENLMQEMRGSTERAIAALEVARHLRDPAFGTFLPNLANHEDLAVRSAALKTIGSCGCQDLAPLLLEGLSSCEPTVVRASCIGLGKLGNDRHSKHLGKAAWHPDWEVRMFAIMALKDLGTPTALDELERLARDDSCPRQHQALSALVDIEDRWPTEELVIRLLKESAGWVLGAAASAVRRENAELCGPVLLERLRCSNDAQLRGETRWFRWTTDEGQSVTWEEIPRSGASVRTLLLRTVAELHLGHDSASVLEETHSREPTSRKAALEALESLDYPRAIARAKELVLVDSNALVRKKCVELLGCSALKYESELRSATMDSSSLVKAAAWLALDGVGLSSPSVLREWSRSPDTASRVAVMMIFKTTAQAELPLILAALEDEQDDVREWAVLCLGNDRFEEAESLLIGALEDQSQYVQAYAATGLGEIGGVRGAEAIIRRIQEDSEVSYQHYSALVSIADRAGLR